MKSLSKLSQEAIESKGEEKRIRWLVWHYAVFFRSVTIRGPYSDTYEFSEDLLDSFRKTAESYLKKQRELEKASHSP